MDESYIRMRWMYDISFTKAQLAKPLQTLDIPPSSLVVLFLCFALSPSPLCAAFPCCSVTMVCLICLVLVIVLLFLALIQCYLRVREILCLGFTSLWLKVGCVCFRCWQSLIAGEEFQHILRVLNTNVDGRQKIMFALTSIKGVGRRFANLVCKKADVDMSKRCANLFVLSSLFLLLKILMCVGTFQILTLRLHGIHSNALTGLAYCLWDLGFRVFCVSTSSWELRMSHLVFL